MRYIYNGETGRLYGCKVYLGLYLFLPVYYHLMGVFPTCLKRFLVNFGYLLFFIVLPQSHCFENTRLKETLTNKKN